MNEVLSLILSLRKVLESVGNGRGVSQSLVRELRSSGPQGKEVAANLLLGLPLDVAARPLLKNQYDEVGMLTSLVIASAESSTSVAGKSGEALSYTMEKWVKARENARLEERVLRFRSLIASGVLGAVSSMIATIGPALGSLGFSGGQDPGASGTVLYAAAAMTLVASGMLGFFMSGRRFYVNVGASALSFILLHVVVAPLASFSQLSLWGIK
jgi:hypothetical protein